jgi:putative ABC transport system ATP-binding protein
MTTTDPILLMENVSKTFPTPHGPVTVLTDVSLRVHAGDFVSITGPSGSGKTTLLNLVALLDQPSSGRLLLSGNDVGAIDEPARVELRKRRVGMVFQRFCLLPHRTVLENVLFRFRYLDTPPAEALQLSRLALDRVDLGPHADQPARLLSGGEMQRVAIARAIALPPDLLLVDEPTGNLDPASGAVIMDHFLRLNQSGVTILMATHNPALAGHTTRHLKCHAGTLSESESAKSESGSRLNNQQSRGSL